VALITIDAVVDIPADLRVLEVVGVVAPMAGGALEDGVVIGVGVARRADAVGIAVVHRELRVLRVIERCACPGRGVVTGCTGRREELRLSRVAGVGRVVVVGLVAADAGDWQGCVITVDVAVGAHPRRHCV